jgi:quinol monooxygenase YgiN
MYTTIARWYVKDDRLDEARTALSALAADVLANEPSTWAYIVHSGMDGSLPPSSPDEIVFFEVYADHQAFLDHVTGPVFTKFLAAHADLFQGAPLAEATPFVQAQVIDRIGGFVRPEATG